MTNVFDINIKKITKNNASNIVKKQKKRAIKIGDKWKKKDWNCESNKKIVNVQKNHDIKFWKKRAQNSGLDIWEWSKNKA